jgi:hypothetical protein
MINMGKTNFDICESKLFISGDYNEYQLVGFEERTTNKGDRKMWVLTFCPVQFKDKTFTFPGKEEIHWENEVKEFIVFESLNGGRVLNHITISEILKSAKTPGDHIGQMVQAMCSNPDQHTFWAKQVINTYTNSQGGISEGMKFGKNFFSQEPSKSEKDSEAATDAMNQQLAAAVNAAAAQVEDEDDVNPF